MGRSECPLPTSGPPPRPNFEDASDDARRGGSWSIRPSGAAGSAAFLQATAGSLVDVSSDRRQHPIDPPGRSGTRLERLAGVALVGFQPGVEDGAQRRPRPRFGGEGAWGCKARGGREVAPRGSSESTAASAALTSSIVGSSRKGLNMSPHKRGLRATIVLIAALAALLALTAAASAETRTGESSTVIRENFPSGKSPSSRPTRPSNRSPEPAPSASPRLPGRSRKAKPSSSRA